MPTQTTSLDVLVVGGGTAGVIAAVQAARAGARTALVEMAGQLGGTITTGGVAAPSYFFAGPRQVIAGIGWELVTSVCRLDGASLPDFRTPGDRPSYAVRVNPYLYALLAEEMALAAGVELHLHQIVTAVHRRDDGWLVDVRGKSHEQRFAVRELIDCTGDADLVGLLGLSRQCSDVRQPGTLMFRLEGFDYRTLDADAIETRYRRALADGTLKPGDFWRLDQPFVSFLRLRGSNAMHVHGADSSTADAQTQANLEGRKAVLRLLRFVRSLPGCEQARLASLCTQTAVRETYRIQGETTVTYEDYVSGRLFPDAVAYSFYFVDVHTDKGVEHEFLKPGIVPTIPLGALIPRGSRRLLVAGRSIDSDRKAHSGLRVQASCMAMGQAVGAAAALAVQRGCASREVPLAELRACLRRHGAIVPSVE